MPLTLARAAGQSIVVNGPCTITVTKTRKGYCLLSIAAEENVTILRGELVPHDDDLPDTDVITGDDPDNFIPD